MKKIVAFHAQEARFPILRFPILAEGNEQWLGGGYYFWQDIEYAKWWGRIKKMNGPLRKYSIFNATLEFDENDFIDTVFNEEDYYFFISKVEKFATEYFSNFRVKPTLEEFNEFIQDYSIWEEIKIIRFQDLPDNDEFLKVRDYHYKKRIQIRVNDPNIITNFVQLK